MIDLEPLKDLLCSLSRISRWNFEVMDAGGGLFSSGPGGKSITSELQRLSTQIMSEAAIQKASLDGSYTLVGVPLKEDQEIIGSLIAHHSYPGGESRHKSSYPEKIPNPEEMESLLVSLTDLLKDYGAVRKECENLTEQLSQMYEDVYLYASLSPRIKTLRFSSATLKDLTEDVLEIMRAGLAFTSFPQHPEYNFLVSQNVITDKISDLKAFIDSLMNVICEQTPSNGGYIIVNDSQMSSPYGALHSDPYRLLVVKIQHENIFYGWLGLLSFNMKEIFRRSELGLLRSIAEQVAVVMTNAELYRDLEKFAINVVMSLVHAIEAKDTYTRGHSEQVNRYSLMIAEQLGVDESEKNRLHWAALLHDIGKIGIPEEILNKPGRLNNEEYSIIMTHSEKGYKILKPLEELSQLLPGVLYHHERFGGGGYPAGLKGDEIPLISRIIAVADTFDAINSNRSYRQGKPADEAMAIVEEVAGSQLDPRIVEAFKKVYQENIGLFSKDKL